MGGPRFTGDLEKIAGSPPPIRATLSPPPLGAARYTSFFSAFYDIGYWAVKGTDNGISLFANRGNFRYAKGMVEGKMEGMERATSIGIKVVKRNGRGKGRAKKRKRGVIIKAYFYIRLIYHHGNPFLLRLTYLSSFSYYNSPIFL